uniref:Uncharacterized protein n=1 Tax=Avena sativa TaxID=4498 RepID=A0ACD5YXM8_AVESA
MHSMRSYFVVGVDQENVVRFLGFCSNTEHTLMPFNGKQVYAERRERLLCFEYVANGSLDRYLTDELRGLEWGVRYGIIKGIFEGLHYLHKEKGMIHMDLKPENILLDAHMVPKITDFGLSRLENSQTTSTQQFFTMGYCAPEYQFHGKMSFKSDMYSLGVIIVELITGRKGIPDINTVHRRWRHRWNKSSRETPLEYKQVTKCIEIALLCLAQDPFRRPFIWDIIGDVKIMDGLDGHIVGDDKSTVCQVGASYSDDDMLCIEPLLLNFPCKFNREMSHPLHLRNETDSCKVFYIEKQTSLIDSIKPAKGVVPPRSTSIVRVILRTHDKVPDEMLYPRQLVVRSTKPKEGLKIDEIISEEVLNEETGYVVDVVDLDILIEEAEPIEVHPSELRFPIWGMSFSISVKVVNTTENHVAFIPWPGAHNMADYYTHPKGEILEPKSEKELVVRRTTKKAVPQSNECNEKYIIYSTIVSKDFKTNNLEKFFKETREDRKWYEKELGVVIEDKFDPIEVHPNELRFPFFQSEGMNFWISVKVVNTTDGHVAFIPRHGDHNVADYHTHPNGAILEPKSTKELVVRRTTKKAVRRSIECNDKYNICSIAVSKDFKTDDLEKFFQETWADRKWHETELGIVLEGTSEPIHPREMLSERMTASTAIIKIFKSSTSVPMNVYPRELQFPFLPSEGMSFSISVKVVNPTDNHVVFIPRHGVDNVADYHTRPIGAILEPRSTQKLVVTRTTKKAGLPTNIECNDKYFLCSTPVSKDFKRVDLDKLFKETRAYRIWDAMELRVAIEAGHELLQSSDGTSEVCSSVARELIRVKQDEASSIILLVNVTEDAVAFFIKADGRTIKGIILPYSTLELVAADTPNWKDKYYLDSTVLSQDLTMTSSLRDNLYETEVGRIWYRVKLDFTHVTLPRPRFWEKIPASSSTLTMDIHPSKPWILMNINHTSKIWNYRTKEMTTLLDDASNGSIPSFITNFFKKSVSPQVTNAKFIAPKQWIVTGHGDGHICVYGGDPMDTIRVLKEHSRDVNCLAIHATEPYMLSACRGGKIVLWDHDNDWQVRRTFQTCGAPSHAAFHPKDSNMFAVSDGEKIKIWNIHTRESMIEFLGHSERVWCFDFFNHRHKLYMISSSFDKTAKIWDCNTGACVQTLQGHTDWVYTACCHPNLPILITGSRDGSVCLWNSKTFRLERTLNFGLDTVYAIGSLKGSTRIAIGHGYGSVLADIGPEAPFA